jgi:hypothetical protein
VHWDRAAGRGGAADGVGAGGGGVEEDWDSVRGHPGSDVHKRSPPPRLGRGRGFADQQRTRTRARAHTCTHAHAHAHAHIRTRTNCRGAPQVEHHVPSSVRLNRLLGQGSLGSDSGWSELDLEVERLAQARARVQGGRVRVCVGVRVSEGWVGRKVCVRVAFECVCVCMGMLCAPLYSRVARVRPASQALSWPNRTGAPWRRGRSQEICGPLALLPPPSAPPHPPNPRGRRRRCRSCTAAARSPSSTTAGRAPASRRARPPHPAPSPGRRARTRAPGKQGATLADAGSRADRRQRAPPGGAPGRRSPPRSS